MIFELYGDITGSDSAKKLHPAVIIESTTPRSDVARVCISMFDDDGQRTEFHQGADFYPHELRAIGRALIAAAEYMEGKRHGA
jgi:hypothetical protein